jgi:bud site selection protein 31
LDDYAKRMRDAENESHEGKRKSESLWPIMRISHTRSRYIYELYYKREAISKELYDWLLKEGYADAKYALVYPRFSDLVVTYSRI